MLTQVTEYGPLLLEWQESSYNFLRPAELQLRPAEAEMVKDGRVLPSIKAVWFYSKGEFSLWSKSLCQTVYEKA